MPTKSFIDRSVLDYVVFMNGVYDILCAFGILFQPNILVFSKFAKLHPTMFSDEAYQKHPILRRILAYWILTYGLIRIAIIRHDIAIDVLVATTYLLEASAFAFEDIAHSTTQRYKVAWVSLTSAFMCIWVVWRALEL